MGRMPLMIFPDGHDQEQLTGHRLDHRNVCPGLAAGTRFPYPTVVIVTNLKNRSRLSEPSPAALKNGKPRELARCLVGRGEEHADQQVGGDGPEEGLGPAVRSGASGR